MFILYIFILLTQYVTFQLSEQAFNDEGLVAEIMTNANTTPTTTISEEITNSRAYGVVSTEFANFQLLIVQFLLLNSEI